MMHNFWAAPDKMAAQMQMAMFIKNLSILGGALMIAYFGTGPLSLDSLFKSKVDKLKFSH
jgi:putative oxidoreductase